LTTTPPGYEKIWVVNDLKFKFLSFKLKDD